MEQQVDRGGADYRLSLADLEASARVRVEDQVVEQAQPPGEGPVSDGELDRLRALGPGRAGRW